MLQSKRLQIQITFSMFLSNMCLNLQSVKNTEEIIKVHRRRLRLASLFRKRGLNAKFWKPALCDVTKGADTSPKLVTTRQSD